MSRNNAGLTTEGIVTEALRIIDGQGLRRLTMRRLGDALGVEAMAVYHHFPLGKEQLFDAIVAHITDVRPTAEDARTTTGQTIADDAGPPPDPRPWNERVHAWARDYRAALLEHSGALVLLINRRPDTPAALRALDAHYSAFAEAGLDDTASAAAAAALDSYVTGAVLHEVRARAPASPDGIADTALDGRFPHVARIARQESAPADQRFHAGLDALLAGLTGAPAQRDR